MPFFRIREGGSLEASISPDPIAIRERADASGKRHLGIRGAQEHWMLGIREGRGSATSPAFFIVLAQVERKEGCRSKQPIVVTEGRSLPFHGDA